MKRFLLLMLCVPLWAQSEYYLPWVPYNDTFQSSIIINNHGGVILDLEIEAVRSPTEKETHTMRIAAFESVRTSAIDLFPELGEGAGYAVRFKNTSSTMSVSAIVWSTTTISGASPSQMNAIPVDQSSHVINFNYMNAGNNGFSAPVAVNVGDGPASIRFYALQNGAEVGTYTSNVATGSVTATSSETMFPGLSGEFYVVAESSQPLLGASFMFNGFREPAMAPAIPLDSVPNPSESVSRLAFSGSNSVEIGETLQLQVSADFHVDGWQDVTDEVTWTLSDPTLVTIDSEGRMRGLKHGYLLLKATFNDVSRQRGFHILGPRLVLDYAPICTVFTFNCDFQEGIYYFPHHRGPYTSGGGFHRLAIGDSEIAVALFKLTAKKEPFKISRISSSDSKGNMTTRVSGLSLGQVIQPGQTVNFSFLAKKIRNGEADLNYIIDVEGIGTIIDFDIDLAVE